MDFVIQGAKEDKSKSKIDTTTVVMDVVFQCSGDDFYNVLTTPDVSIPLFNCNYFFFIKNFFFT